MPLVNRTFDQLINFTRTTAATFVGSNGLIQTTPQSRNLLTFTEEFDNAAWTKTNSTITANSTAAPDGTMTADTLTASAGTGLIPRVADTSVLTVNGAAHTASMYVRAGTYTFFQIYINNQAAEWANFTLTGVGTASANGSCTATITALSGGWYRCTMSYTAGGTDRRPLFMMAASGSATRAQTWNPAGTETIFIWGAQLEQASTATDYTRNFGGLFPPRFDYDPVTLAPRGLLIEEQRTNLLLRSEEFDNASWAKAGTTVTANAIVSPDGTVDADALVEDATTGLHLTQQFFTFLNATAYTFSVYVRPSTRTWVSLTLPSAAFGAAQGGFFDLTGAGALGNTTGTPTSRSITAVGGGWYRLTVTATSTAAAGGNIAVVAASANGTTSYAGNSSTAVHLYGAQLEAGAFATSYIPTVASQVTRTADTAAIQAPNFASWYNSSQGTLLVEASQPSIFASSRTAASVSDGGTNRFNVYRQSAGNVQGFITPGAGALATTVIAVANVPWKGALGYDTTTGSFAANGSAVASGSHTIPLGALTALAIGSVQPTGGEIFNGHIRSIRYYPSRLSNAQLQALTA